MKSVTEAHINSLERPQCTVKTATVREFLVREFLGDSSTNFFLIGWYVVLKVAVVRVHLVPFDLLDIY